MQALSLTLLSTLLPLLAAAQESSDSTPNSSNSDYTDGSFYDDVGSPTEAGASGDDTGAFQLSKGALIAIVVVAVVVVVLGAGSLILWRIAKKRQWEVRASIRRASRRLTGRGGDTRSRRQTRRSGVRLASPPRKSRVDRDLEKGHVQEKPRTTTTIKSTFEVETPTAKSWKQKLPGWTRSK